MSRGEFRTTLGGVIVSANGFRVRIYGPLAILYEDAQGSLEISAEADSYGSGVGATVFTKSVPDTPARPKQKVLADIARAFSFAGWRLHFEFSGDELPQE